MSPLAKSTSLSSDTSRCHDIRRASGFGRPRLSTATSGSRKTSADSLTGLIFPFATKFPPDTSPNRAFLCLSSEQQSKISSSGSVGCQPCRFWETVPSSEHQDQEGCPGIRRATSSLHCHMRSFGRSLRHSPAR